MIKLLFINIKIFYIVKKIGQNFFVKRLISKYSTLITRFTIKQHLRNNDDYYLIRHNLLFHIVKISFTHIPSLYKQLKHK